MELWQDEHAVLTLKLATSIENVHGMPDRAIQALVAYPQAHQFLLELAEQKPALKHIIASAISQK